MHDRNDVYLFIIDEMDQNFCLFYFSSFFKKKRDVW